MADDIMYHVSSIISSHIVLFITEKARLSYGALFLLAYLA